MASFMSRIGALMMCRETNAHKTACRNHDISCYSIANHSLLEAS